LRLPAYAVNRSKRLIKAPKLFWGDTGIALHLVGTEPQGSHLENLVLHDLLARRPSGSGGTGVLAHDHRRGGGFRDRGRGQLLPIEVKASPSPRLADCAHLRSCSTPAAASNGSPPMCWRLRGGE
jgi:predicted AAA+ superfamily ATPase